MQESFVEIARAGLKSYLPALARGGNPAPMRVLASVQALADAGGRIGPLEALQAARAIAAAAQNEVLTSEEKQQLLNLLKRLLALLGDYAEGYYRYPKTPVKTDAAPVDADSVAVTAAPESEGLEWRVRLIESGETVDHRCIYTPEAIRRAVNLFEGVQCFADHAPEGEVPSVGRLVGWFSDPRLVEENDRVAIDAVLHVFETSPFAGLLREVYQRNALSTIGFSIRGTGKVRLEQRNGRTVQVVESIDSISSVDLVSKPNAGGRLLELRAAVCEATDSLPEVSPPVEQPEPQAMVSSVLTEIQRMQEELQRERVRIAVRELLASVNLPEAVVRVIRPRLDGATSLQEAEQIVAEAQTMWAIAQESQTRRPVLYQVPAPDRRVLRLQGLIAGQPIDNVEPYRSLREAYADITGVQVWDMSPSALATQIVRGSAGFDSSLRATIDPTSWAYALGDAVHRELIREYNLPQFDDWKKVASVVSNLSDMRQAERIRHGYFDILPEVTDTYQFLTSPGEQRAYYAPTRYGGLADYTWEAALNDDLGALKAIPKKLALSAKVGVWYRVFSIFANAVSPTCTYDGLPLFSSEHGNLGAVNLSSATFAAARKAMMTQTAMGNTYLSLGVPPRYMLVPPDLEQKALQLRNSEFDPDDPNGKTGNAWRGSFDVIVIPFWQDGNAWALVADPQLVPTIEVGFLGGREEPELYTEVPNSGSNFTADRIVFKIRHVFGICILDHRGMYKSNGAT